MSKQVRKGLLIFPILKDVGIADGIVTKNEGIRTGFLNNNVEADVLEFFSTGVFINDEKIYSFHSNRYRRIYQHNVKSWSKIRKYILSKQYDFIWFRTPMILSPVANFIVGLKKQNPKCQIILEYGYYPFINELGSLAKTLYKLNRRNELKAHRHADYVVTYSGIDHVDNLVNIPINNGIDLQGLRQVSIQTDIKTRVNFICVSSLKKWHAYERMIEGLNEYKKNPGHQPVLFNIVGNGPVLPHLKKMVEQMKLEKYVSFHGFKTGVELDEVYDDNHIAIGTLGLHRLNITFSSSLKNREYLGRGLPMVLSTKDEDMPESLPFILYVSDDEKPVDIQKLVLFAQEIYQNSEINKQVRSYAEKVVSWDSKIETVIQYLKNGRPEKD
jgi:hypothetical protein